MSKKLKHVYPTAKINKESGCKWFLCNNVEGNKTNPRLDPSAKVLVVNVFHPIIINTGRGLPSLGHFSLGVAHPWEPWKKVLETPFISGIKLH